MKEESCDERVKALLSAHVFHQFLNNYESLLLRRVFPFPINNRDDRTKQLKHQGKLLQPKTLQVLDIIWKESRYISDKDLSAAGYRRVLDGKEITQSGLARTLASLSRTSPDEAIKIFQAVNSNVRQIGISAAAYGLVDRKEVAPNRVVLSGNKKLHEFMCELHLRNAEIIRRPSNTPVQHAPSDSASAFGQA